MQARNIIYCLWLISIQKCELNNNKYMFPYFHISPMEAFRAPYGAVDRPLQAEFPMVTLWLHPLRRGCDSAIPQLPVSYGDLGSKWR